MDPKAMKNTKKTFFNSPKRQPLVRKMIFDPHQANAPLSCYELRPIHEGESNQQEMIFDSHSSSLKEISQFEKNSPHELDNMIYGHNEHSIHNENIFMDCVRGDNSGQYSFKIHEESLSHSESSNQRKRQNPISHEETQRYQNIQKVVQLSEIQNQERDDADKYTFSNLQNRISFNSPVMKGKSSKQKWINLENSQKRSKWPSRYNSSLMKQEKIFDQDMEENEGQKPVYQKIRKVVPKNEEVKIQEISPQINVSMYLGSEKKAVRRKVDNPEFQLVNQYMELASYAAIVDEMILVYDKSPLFEFSLDFDSQTEDDNSDKAQKQKEIQEQKVPKSDCSMQQECEVKIEHEEKQKLDESSNRIEPISKSEKELYTQFEKLKLSEATDEKERQRIIKEINFNRSKTYYNFYEPIKQLRPYIKRMTLEEKKMFLAFKKELKEIKDIIDYFERKNPGQKKEHICKLCGEEFESGRQLGGHMSRKHPGKAIEYGFKKELHKVKEIERNRRKYFKELEEEIKLEQ